MELLNKIVSWLLFFTICTVGMNIGRASDGENETWNAFVNNPNNTTYEILKTELIICWRKNNCKESLSPSANQNQILLQHIRNEDFLAADIGFFSLALNLADGGEVEELIEVLGQLLSKNSEYILRKVTEHSIQDPGLENLVCKMPYETVDDFPGKVIITRDRIVAITNVNNPELGVVREKALRYLAECLEFYEQGQ